MSLLSPYLQPRDFWYANVHVAFTILAPELLLSFYIFVAYLSDCQCANQFFFVQRWEVLSVFHHVLTVYPCWSSPLIEGCFLITLLGS